jgi:hypothetical protein
VPTKGLYTSAVADSIGPEITPWCQNVRFRFGQVSRSPGRSVVLHADVFVGPFIDFLVHVNAAGTETEFAMGWTGSQHAVRPYDPDTRTFPTAQQLVCPNHYSGQVRASWCQGEERLFVVCASTITAINVTSPGVFSVETLTSPPGLFVEYFNNRLFLMNTQAVSNRIQWSARANYNNWNTTTGTGGFLDLYDGAVEAITGGRTLNDRLVIYREKSITDMVPTGDDTAPFLPQGKVHGIGCMAPWSLASLGQFHLFLANDYNVYMWDGAKLNAIGTPIHNYIRQLYDPLQSTNWYAQPYATTFMSYKEYWLAMFDFTKNQYVVLIYDYQRDTWTRDVFPPDLYALLERTLVGAEGTAGYDRTDYPARWPSLMAGRGNDYFMVDERVDGDRLANPTTGAMEIFVETPDFYYSQDAMQNGTMQRAMVVSGVHLPSEPGYHFDLSTNRGVDWIQSPRVIPVPTHEGYEFTDFNITSHVYRWRLRCAETDGVASKPSWRSYVSVYVPSGDFFPTEHVTITEPTQRGEVPPTGVDGG